METIKNLICEIIKYLENNQLNKGDIEISKYLKNMPLESENFNELDSNNPPKKNSLLQALDTINNPSLFSIKETINLSLESLRWSIDNGLYYDKRNNRCSMCIRNTYNSNIPIVWNGRVMVIICLQNM